jgi:hypothetical protein
VDDDIRFRAGTCRRGAIEGRYGVARSFVGVVLAGVLAFGSIAAGITEAGITDAGITASLVAAAGAAS